MPSENNSNIISPEGSSVDSGVSSPEADKPDKQAVKADKPAKSKPWLKYVLALVIVVALLVATAFVAYDQGKKHQKVVTAAPALKQLTLPRQTTVYSACTPGRGEQYVVTSTLPEGPIYDVKNNKVIAIEYVLSLNGLFQNSSAFSTAILQLTKNYPVDHFTLVPDATQATSPSAIQGIHLIMFVVKQSVADSITCSGTGGSSATGSSTSSTTNP